MNFAAYLVKVLGPIAVVILLVSMLSGSLGGGGGGIEAFDLMGDFLGGSVTDNSHESILTTSDNMKLANRTMTDIGSVITNG
ncbi:hypothetical protein [Citricoccus nitrophenolicus]|uniref:hypothetical protein n=1 Tax=Citricoccus nitrophenolicus TaxID=863575 RepID=UPI0031EB5363